MTLASNHSPRLSATFAGPGITSVITRSPASGESTARIVPPSLHWPTTSGSQSLPAPGVPKLPVSNSLSLPWHQCVVSSLNVYSGSDALDSSREWPSLTVSYCAESISESPHDSLSLPPSVLKKSPRSAAYP